MKQAKKLFAFAIVFSIIVALVPAALAEQANKVNINKASIEELITLKNVGQKYAERIIAYREKNGPFQKCEDITKVKGIGEKILAVNADKITVK